jgi:hypothetical protein
VLNLGIPDNEIVYDGGNRIYIDLEGSNFALEIQLYGNTNPVVVMCDH